MPTRSEKNVKPDTAARKHADTCDVSCIHPEAVARAARNALDKNPAADLARLFQVMADPSRLRIISLLTAGELCVCDIAAALDMTQSAISHQLRILRIAQLVRYRKEGRIAFYSLSDDHVLKLYTQGLDHLGHASKGQ